MHMNIQVATTECCLCQEAVLETNKHLFVQCEYVTRVRTALISWTNTPMPATDLSLNLEMIRKKHWKKFKKEVIEALSGAWFIIFGKQGIGNISKEQVFNMLI